MTAFTSTGVSELDVASVVAVPGCARRAGQPGRGPTDARKRAAPAGCTSYPTTERSSPPPRTRSRRRPAVAAAERELAEVEASVESLNARRLQLQGEADELRRRLAAIEDDVDEVDDELEEAEEARDDAQAVLQEAQRAQRRPRRRWPGCRTPTARCRCVA